MLNAAVKLDGQNPVEAVVKKIPGNQIVLASADSGAEQAFSEISQLQDSSNPYDPFALHKAALIACGIIPYREQISVEEVTKTLGSGLYLSTQVIHIPRGSGLGTSSILAGACVKAIYRMSCTTGFCVWSRLCPRVAAGRIRWADLRPESKW